MTGKATFRLTVFSALLPLTFPDPALGSRIADKKQFAEKWNGMVFATISLGFDRNSVLFNPETLAARHLINAFRPLPGAKLLDSGFAHAGLS